MTKLSLKSVLALTASAAMLSAFSAETVHAQDGDVVEDEIITIGTRRQARSANDSTAPIDVISGDEFVNQASTDLTDLLRASVPSYNVNTQPISDAATLVRPANLRGLSPDNTLILLNGKRRHRAAVISFLGGGLADGAQGPDVSVFPSLALKQVEVLRDGASSQYGSDAIAGVMNFTLKDDTDGGSIMAKYGSTYDGDGDNYVIAANYGMGIGENGFINVTGEFREADGTFRSIQRTDAANLIAAGNAAVGSIDVNTVTDEFVQYWGSPDISNDMKLFVNTGFELSENMELYAFGNYAERTGEGGFFFRNPTNRGGVYDGPLVDPTTGLRDPNGVPSVLVGDPDGIGGCPDGIPLTGTNGLIPDGGLLSSISTGGALAHCFSFVETIPGGFTPRFGGDLTDYSIVGGLRGELDVGNGLSYDVSASRGENEAQFFIRNTVNASLGPDTPRDFNPGAYTQTETNFNVDLGYALPVEGMAGDLNIAAGFEWREEEFEVTAGDPASFTDPANISARQANLLAQGFAPNSNGFGGFTQASAGKNAQSNIALYADLEGDITDNLTLQGALRWEDFDVFGDTLNYKVGGLYRVNDDFRVRGTYSTGFHAPTAGQANVTNVSTVFTGGQLVDRGTLPVTTTAAQFVNPGASLDAEKAKNVSLGFVVDVGGGDLTVDFFNINVRDRISQSDDLDFQQALIDLANTNGVALPGVLTTFNLLQALDGVNGFNANDFAGFEGLTTFRTFANDFDTRTRGVDVVYNVPFDFLEGRSRFTLVGNYTDTDVTDAGNLGATRIRQLEENLPKVRGSATWSHEQGQISGLLRANYYGKFYEAHLDDGTLPINAGSEVTLDAEIGYEVMEGLKISAGAENLLDNYPDRNPWDFIVGAAYPVTSPFGFNGGQYYVRARYDF